MMMHSPLAIVLLAIVAVGVNAENETCDRILDSMIDGCKTVRNTLISTDSLDPKVACCKNARYDLCVQGVKGYVTVAKTTRACPEPDYEAKLEDLTNNIAMKAVKKLCENYDTKACITETISGAWGSLTQTLNSTFNSENLSKNFNEAMSSISSFMKNIGGQIQSQNITEKLKEQASSLSSSLRGMIPQRPSTDTGTDHYSVLPDEQPGPAAQQPHGAESGNSFSFTKLFNSIIPPSIEVVPKKD